MSRLAAVFLLVRDLARSRAFYEALLGDSPEKATASEVRFATAGGTALTLHADLPNGERRAWGMPPEAGARGWGVYVTLATTDLEAAAARAAGAGGRLVRPPGPAPWGGRFALLTDPDGYWLELKDEAA